MNKIIYFIPRFLKNFWRMDGRELQKYPHLSNPLRRLWVRLRFAGVIAYTGNTVVRIEVREREEGE